MVGLEKAVGRGRLDVQADFGTPHREDGVADGVPAHHEVERDVVGLAVREAEEAAVVLVEIEVLVTEAGVDHEPVVRFVPALANGRRHGGDHQRLAQAVVGPVFEPLRLAVGLDGAPGRHSECIGLLAAKPRLGEAQIIALEEETVGLGTDADPLAIPHGDRSPGPLLEGLAHGEVVEGHTRNRQCGRPIRLQLDLVGGLLLDDVFDVDCTVLGFCTGLMPKASGLK